MWQLRTVHTIKDSESTGISVPPFIMFLATSNVSPQRQNRDEKEEEKEKEEDKRVLLIHKDGMRHTS